MKKRLKRGRDWHGWAWKCGDADMLGYIFHWAEPFRPRKKSTPTLEAYTDAQPTPKGKWVRVKFVEVKS